MRTAAVILAAGASTRFGSRKQDASIDGRRMVDIVAATAAEAGLEPLLEVVPPGVEATERTIPILNAEPEAGISRSLRLGIGALLDEVEAAVVLLGDEPLIEAATLGALIQAAEAGAPVVATRFEDRIGPPLILRRAAFSLVERTTGDEGLGPILRSVPGLLTLDLARPPIDVDTTADLDALAASWHDEFDR